MPLYKPYLRSTQTENGMWLIAHNCNGSIAFPASDIVDENTWRLIELAIEEGKRRKITELFDVLGMVK